MILTNTIESHNTSCPPSPKAITVMAINPSPVVERRAELQNLKCLKISSRTLEEVLKDLKSNIAFIPLTLPGILPLQYGHDNRKRS